MVNKEFRLVRAKFTVASSVTEKQIEDKLKGLTGYEKLSLGVTDMIEATSGGETFSKIKPKSEPEPEPEEK